MMESQEANQNPRRASAPPLGQKKGDEDDIQLRIPRRVSFHDETGAKDDPELRVFRMRVFYSEVPIEGAIKTYPQTKVASIVSPLLANRSNFVNSIRKKLQSFGVNPHTRLTLTPVPRVPDDRDYSIAHWLKKYSGAAFIVSPEDEQDSLYRQLVTLKGQPATRNPLYQSEPDIPPISVASKPPVTPSQSSQAETTQESSSAKGDSARGAGTSLTLESVSVPPPTVSVTINEEMSSLEAGNVSCGDVSPATPGSPATPNSGVSSSGSATSFEHIVETHRGELIVVEEKLFEATSQLMILDKEHAVKDMTIQVLERRLQEYNHRIDEVEQALNFMKTESYQARLREVYRRMFLECVRTKLRAKLRAWFKCPPNPVDYLLVSYDKVLETCEEMENLENHVGLSLEDLKLTAEDASTSQSGIHPNENIHIGVYAEVAHSQDSEHLPAYRNLFFFLYNQEPQTVLDNLIRSWT